MDRFENKPQVPPVQQPQPGPPVQQPQPGPPVQQPQPGPPMPMGQQFPPPVGQPSQPPTGQPTTPPLRSMQVPAPVSSTTTPTLSPQGGIAPGRHRIHLAYVVMNTLTAMLIILITLLSVFLPILLGEELAEGLEEYSGWMVLITLAIIVLSLGLVILYAILYYIRFSWQITESEIHVYSGVLFKKQAHVPFIRVQSVDFKASIPERILGIVKLSIETAGGATNRAVTIPALKLNEAEAFRAEVFSRKRYATVVEEQRIAAAAQAMRGQPPATPQPFSQPTPGPELYGQPPTPRYDPITGQLLEPAYLGLSTLGSTADQFVTSVGDLSMEVRGIFAEQYDELAPIEFEYNLKAKELLLAAISDDSNLISILLGLAALFQVFQMFSPLVVENYSTEIESDLNVWLPVVIFSLIGAFLFIFMIAVLKTAVGYGGFRARRRGGRIEVDHGLLQRVYRGVGIRRVQSVVIKQGFLRRLFGYAELSLQTVDTAQAQNTPESNNAILTRGLLLHPFVKMKRIDELLHGLLPEFDSRPLASERLPLPKVARRRRIVRNALLPALFLLPVMVLPWALFEIWLSQATIAEIDVATLILRGIFIFLAVLWLLLLVMNIIGALLWYRHARYGWSNDFLSISQGAWMITDTFVPRKKIQWGEYKQTPFQRWSKVATIQATTAAGVVSTNTKLRDLSMETAKAYLDWLRPRGREMKGLGG